MIRTDIAPLELPVTQDWTATLRRINQGLFALLPVLLLFWRGGADAAASIIGVSFLAVVIAKRQWGLATHPLLAVLLVIWLMLNLLVSPLAVEPAQSFSRSIVWLRFALLFAAVITWLIQSRNDLRIIVGLWAVTIAFCIIDGTVQLLHGTSLTGNPMYNLVRLTGPLERPNIGMFVTRIGFPLLAVAPLLLPDVRSRAIWTGAALLAGAGFAFVLLTGERSAALLAVAGLLTAGLGGILIFPRYRLYGLSALLLVCIVIAAIAATSERILGRIMQLGGVLRHFSESHYAELFGIGIDVWRTYPIFGAGMKNFGDACWAVSGSSVSDGCPTHPHNVYIEWLAETGAAGLLGYLVFLVLLLLAAWPLLRGTATARVIGVLVAGCMVVLLFPLIASQSLFSNWPALVFWCSLSLTMAVARLGLKDTA
ncbi:MAG: O-antigen ligase family protein [Ferrovibrio sp.]|uniref:O-antigen ligase family protein n=1 Tax=Ferrovibrio sp. TaxID=1917215 RepID=UPI0026271A83|nr:O-antigen ligase family protein [Ferrovibrio sp.]MCW0236502.1 O-antigen ligase family protein [Ferrovibrio sp.]